jgi:hypothetical protein
MVTIFARAGRHTRSGRWELGEERTGHDSYLRRLEARTTIGPI